jgi:hypothetical protein
MVMLTGILVDPPSGQSSEPVSTGSHVEPRASTPVAECVVCQESLGDGELRTLPCGHVFHEACIAQWEIATPMPTCPVCRTRIGTGVIVGDTDMSAEARLQSAFSIIVTDMRNANARGIVLDALNFTMLLMQIYHIFSYAMVSLLSLVAIGSIVTTLRLSILSRDHQPRQLNYIRCVLSYFEHLLIMRAVVLCCYVGTLVLTSAPAYDPDVAAYIIASISTNGMQILNDILFLGSLRLARSVLFTLSRERARMNEVL